MKKQTDDIEEGYAAVIDAIENKELAQEVVAIMRSTHSLMEKAKQHNINLFVFLDPKVDTMSGISLMHASGEPNDDSEETEVSPLPLICDMLTDVPISILPDVGKVLVSFKQVVNKVSGSLSDEEDKPCNCPVCQAERAKTASNEPEINPTSKTKH